MGRTCLGSASNDTAGAPADASAPATQPVLSGDPSHRGINKSSEAAVPSGLHHSCVRARDHPGASVEMRCEMGVAKESIGPIVLSTYVTGLVSVAGRVSYMLRNASKVSEEFHSRSIPSKYAGAIPVLMFRTRNPGRFGEFCWSMCGMK